MFLLAWLSLPTAGAMTAGTMAARGVVRGAVHVVSAPAPLATGSTVQVVVADYDSAAWGDGRHPTTALCLEWLSGQSWSPGARMLDYGCGTGVLLCAAAMLGCGDVVGVDIDDEILKVARLNVAANDLEGVEITHGRHVVPGAFAPADVVVANILVGALSRPSMVATLALGCKPGAKLCLSGFRPGAETEVLLQLYRPFFTFDQSGYAERAPDAHGQEYRGTWTRVVATRNVDSAETRRQLIDKIADDAVNG